MAIKTHKVTLSLDNPRVIQSGINVQSFDKQSIQISIELTKNDEVFQVPSDATIRISLLKLARQEQKIIVDVPNTNRESIDWIVPDYLDGYQGTVRVGVYLVSGAENVDLGYFTILSNVSDIDKMADEFTDNVFQGWEQIEADLNELNLTIAQTKLDLADDLTQIDNTIANINTLASDFTADVATKQADVTSKYNAFDTSVTTANQTIDDILALQPQFQDVIDGTTGKDVISAPEIILARNGKSNLKTRLDDEHAQVTAQLAQTAQQLESKAEKIEVAAVDSRVDNLVIPISAENANIEVTDAHNSIVKSKTFESLKKRFEEIEGEVITNANLKLANMITNPEFSDTQGWIASNVSFTANLKALKILATPTSGEHYAEKVINGEEILESTNYYIRAKVTNLKNALARLRMFNKKADGTHETVDSGSIESDGVLSAILPTTTVNSVPRMMYRIALNNIAGSGSFVGSDEELTLSQPLVLNLNKSFGDNIPTKEELDRMFDIVEGINGEIVLDQKRNTNILTLATRENKNNISSLTADINKINADFRPKAIASGGGDASLNFDFKSKQIIVTNLALTYGTNIKVFSRTVDISGAYVDASSKNKDYILYFDTGLSVLSYMVATSALPTNAIVIAVFRPLTKQVWGCDFKYQINGISNTRYKYPFDMEMNKVFNKNVTIPENLTIPNKTSAEIYALYDDLVSLYPDYVTKTFLGNEATGLPIYRYDFKPLKPDTNYVMPSAKVIVTTGTHPEKTATLTMYEVMNNICNNWQDDEVLEALRHNIHFIVVPIMSPWSFNNNSRVNSRGVDLARNFPSGWVQGTYVAPPNASSTYGGTAPLSELESQYISQIILGNLDALAVIDFHNFFNSPVEFLWAACGKNRARDITSSWIQKMTRKWKKEYPAYAIGEFVGDVVGDYPGGSLGIYAEDIGIDAGMTVEIDQKFYGKADSTANDSTTLTLGYEAIVNFFAKLIHELNENR